MEDRVKEKILTIINSSDSPLYLNEIRKVVSCSESKIRSVLQDLTYEGKVRKIRIIPKYPDMFNSYHVVYESTNIIDTRQYITKSDEEALNKELHDLKDEYIALLRNREDLDTKISDTTSRIKDASTQILLGYK